MPEKPRITQAALAEEAGVTQVTVSLALRNDPSISEATRQRIQQLAKDRGYIPDPALSSLIAYRQRVRPPAYHGTLAWLNLTEYKEAHENWLGWRDFLGGGRQRAEQLGYRIESVWGMEPGMSLRRIKQILKSRGTRGVVLPPTTSPRLEQAVDIDAHSVIRIGDYSMITSDYNLVAADHRWAIERVLREVEQRGYKRPGYVTYQDFERRINLTYLSTYLGWRHTQTKLKLQQPYNPVDFDQATFLAWYEKHKPDVLILPNNHNVIKCLDWLDKELGQSAPRDYGLVFACVPLDGNNAWAGVDEGFKTIGGRTIDFLVDMINRNEIGLPTRPTRHLIHGQWQEGHTLPKRAGQG